MKHLDHLIFLGDGFQVCLIMYMPQTVVGISQVLLDTGRCGPFTADVGHHDDAF